MTVPMGRVKHSEKKGADRKLTVRHSCDNLDDEPKLRREFKALGGLDENRGQIEFIASFRLLYWKVKGKNKTVSG